MLLIIEIIGTIDSKKTTRILFDDIENLTLLRDAAAIIRFGGVKVADSIYSEKDLYSYIDAMIEDFEGPHNIEDIKIHLVKYIQEIEAYI